MVVIKGPEATAGSTRDLFEKQRNTGTDRAGDQHGQQQGDSDACGYRIGKGDVSLPLIAINIESDQ